MRVKQLFILITVLFLATSCMNTDPKNDAAIMPVAGESEDLAGLINPMIGTDSEFLLSNGNTYPTIALPWGMNFWTPKTNEMGNGWCYQYCADKINGIKQTHQASPWLNDYGAFAIFALTDKLAFTEEERQSWFSHKSEVSEAYYYSVYLGDYHTTIEVTPTERCAMFRITWPETDSAILVVDGFHKGSFVQIIPEEKKIIGYAMNNHGGVPENFKNYFVIKSDTPFDEIFGVENTEIIPGKLTNESAHSGALIRFNTKAGEQVHLETGSSFISWEQAERNLENEIGNDTFDQVRTKARQTWNEHMNRIRVEGGTRDQLITFYTALYRTMLFPRKFYEFGANGQPIHYSPYNGNVEEGYMFTDNGFWDTFRAVFPFFNLMFRDLNSKIMQGLANTYRESGWLPEWASPGHRSVMIGSNSASIIADAYLKGIDMPDRDILYEAILKNSENEGPLRSVGRYGVDYYNRLGYIPYDVGINENTARTLEYAYDDFTIAEMAEKSGRPAEEVGLFRQRSMNYKNVFDPTINFMRGKNLDGTFQQPFRPDKWGDAFTEGCSWHWTWCVFHDVEGLIGLMGGNEAFNKKLDAVFTTPPTADHSYYGFQIHEITEMKIINMGQYAHGNQPIQHMPYLYNYSGQPWKTQYHVRNIMDRLYTPEADGLCGDEDNGQTSAWYVFSAMGMYPVTPGAGQYALGSPLFSAVTLQLENGNTFRIEAPENSPKHYYIRNARLNDKPWTRNFIAHDEIMKGGTLHLEMDTSPDRTRGTTPADAPFSVSGPVSQQE
ncbi:MAG: GH92 family glycosyl hydrolase [Bacteroidales bacterium]|nr:GH92 family glycosyl hydrolase [Bacteroidales bacterium]MDT8432615.1 GH92 family glycosyl hydrolase [Bacteroidales bacterium]